MAAEHLNASLTPHYKSMAKVITITNNKGGTGKTATAVNLAAAFRLRGLDVLLIDYDGQANATDTLRVPTDGGTIYDAVREPITEYLPPVRVLSPGNGAGVLDVVPSCSDLSAVEVELSNQPDRVTRFGSVVNKYRDKYDVIMIDTPPTLGLLTISALYAADELIIPTQPQYLAVRGLLALNDVLRTVKEYKQGGPLVARVLFTQYDNRKGLHRMTVDQVRAAGFDTFSTFNTLIRDNVALGEAPAAGLDIFRYSPRSNGAKDYGALAEEFARVSKVRHLNHKHK